MATAAADAYRRAAVFTSRHSLGGGHFSFIVACWLVVAAYGVSLNAVSAVHVSATGIFQRMAGIFSVRSGCALLAHRSCISSGIHAGIAQRLAYGGATAYGISWLRAAAYRCQHRRGFIARCVAA